ncbi:hypothetical protein [Massilia sp. TSP1-1-2]|uniref:hypothetical protein n=1 Tax=Massilia sp. TSP1-1-2 TaxID=2804649 RepID=UPI003CECCE1A
MTTATTTAAAGANQLFDFIIEKMALKNDAALGRALEVAPPVISKIRHGKLPVTARMMIKIHDVANMSIREIRTFLGTEPK